MDSTSLTIIGALGMAIVALSGFITKLYSDLAAARAALVECQQARIATAEEHYRELAVLRNAVKRKKGDRS